MKIGRYVTVPRPRRLEPHEFSLVESRRRGSFVRQNEIPSLRDGGEFGTESSERASPILIWGRKPLNGIRPILIPDKPRREIRVKPSQC